MTRVRFAAMFMVWIWGAGAFGGESVFEFANPEQEQRFQALTSELRCLVCQNQSLADSHADLAGDLRSEVYNMLQQGKSDQEIIEFMVQRYGTFVLYRPRIQTQTLVLWFGPAVLLFVGGYLLVRGIRQRTSHTAPPTLTPDEQREAERLLQGYATTAQQGKSNESRS